MGVQGPVGPWWGAGATLKKNWLLKCKKQPLLVFKVCKCIQKVEGNKRENKYSLVMWVLLLSFTSLIIHPIRKLNFISKKCVYICTFIYSFIFNYNSIKINQNLWELGDWIQSLFKREKKLNCVKKTFIYICTCTYIYKVWFSRNLFNIQ